jgi:hypothetical protein
MAKWSGRASPEGPGPWSAPQQDYDFVANDPRRTAMLKVLFGSQTGILSIITVVGATLVVVGFSYWMYRKSLGKSE